MKRIRTLFGVLGLLLLIGGSQSSFAETVKLDIGEWAPFTSEKDQNGKIAEVLVKEAFKLEGYQVELNYYPWKRSYERVKLGQSDGTFPWFINSDRGDTQFFIISRESVIRDKEVFFYRKDRPFNWTTFEDLKKYSIGGVIGYSHISQLKRHGIQLETVANENQNYRKLMAGRLDAAPGSVVVGYQMIRSMFPKSQWDLITHHDKPLREADMFIFFSRQSPRSQELEAVFSNGMKKLKDSGRYSTILDQFLLAGSSE